MPSIKSQIIARLLDLASPLLTEGKFRLIVRKSAPLLLEAVKPAIHLVVGDESVVSQAEDIRGYLMEFPAIFQLIVSDVKDPYSLADDSVAFLQEKIETDPQLSGLVNCIKYDGETPLTTETEKPVGYTLVTYLIQYRRLRGNPSQQY